MDVLKVTNLRKTYPAFTLNDVSFDLKKGAITGFIGRNGAGKSTTLNSLFNFVHPDSGTIEFFGMNFSGNEAAIKKRVGFVSSGVNYYPKKKLKTISGITKSFYDSWDDAAYKKYMSLFSLDESKTPSQLSAGMKVKYALALALSHNADLLILDEPTSGLDPVSRDDLLDVFLSLCDEGKTILFSTHITTDLDKCAENIIYIKHGSIIAQSGMKEFESGYKIASYETESAIPAFALGHRRVKGGFTALIKTSDAPGAGGEVAPADLESVMVHLEKEAE